MKHTNEKHTNNMFGSQHHHYQMWRLHTTTLHMYLRNNTISGYYLTCTMHLSAVFLSAGSKFIFFPELSSRMGEN